MSSGTNVLTEILVKFVPSTCGTWVGSARSSGFRGTALSVDMRGHVNQLERNKC